VSSWDSLYQLSANLPLKKIHSATAFIGCGRIDAAQFLAHTAARMNQLYYGDNLQTLCEHIADES
jgi:hypothetical protein